MIERLEARLTVALRTSAAPTVVRQVEPSPAPAEAVEAAVENGANVWPDEIAEQAFLAEQSPARETAPAVAVKAEPDETNAPMPDLDELVKRISPETRELLDELFRAKFNAVRRVPKTALKT